MTKLFTEIRVAVAEAPRLFFAPLIGAVDAIKSTAQASPSAGGKTSGTFASPAAAKAPQRRGQKSQK